MTRNRSLELDLETLLRHDRGLQAIARAIVGDDLARDAVQQTWLAALTRGPRDTRRLAPWLRRVAKRFALMLRRKELQRRRHEEVAAHPVASEPGAAEAVERMALRRTLAQAALGAAASDPVRDLHSNRSPVPASTAMHAQSPSLQRGRVLDVRGAPVPGVQVLVEDAAIHGAVLKTTPSGETTPIAASNAHGDFAAPPASGILRVAPPWITVYTEWFPSAGADPATIVVAPAIDLEGTVTDPSGIPLTDVEVVPRLDPPVHFPGSLEQAMRVALEPTKTDREGRFHLRRVPAGVCSVELHKPGHAADLQATPAMFCLPRAHRFPTCWCTHGVSRMCEAAIQQWILRSPRTSRSCAWAAPRPGRRRRSVYSMRRPGDPDPEEAHQVDLDGETTAVRGQVGRAGRERIGDRARGISRRAGAPDPDPTEAGGGRRHHPVSSYSLPPRELTRGFDKGSADPRA